MNARSTTPSQLPADTRQPVLPLTVGALLREAAAEAPDALALVAGMPDPAARRTWTYAELLEDAERTARALLARFEPGDHVAVWSPNFPEWILLEYGCALAGLVLVTVNPSLKQGEVRYVLEQSRAAGVFAPASFRDAPMGEVARALAGELPELREVVTFDAFDAFLAGGDPAAALPEVAPTDPVQIQYTSGTTGFPKGARLHHQGIVNNARFILERVELGDDRSAWVNPMPLFHTGGCVIATLGAAWQRAPMVLVPWFDPALIWDLVGSYGASLVAGVPTMLVGLESVPEAQQAPATLRRVVTGGSVVPAPLVRRVEREWGVSIANVYGQTELAPVVAMTGPADSAEDKAHTIGRPLPQVEVKIVDPLSGEVVPRGVSGEICARGYQKMLDYFEMPGATAETIDAEGWLHTGDLASMDARGYLTITGRLKDMIIRGGENLYPREIEERLFAHPAVASVAVVARPSETWGEEVAAVLVPKPGETLPSAAELKAWCREALSPQKTPAHWYGAEALPLTASGKIRKFVLAEQVAAGKLTPLA